MGSKYDNRLMGVTSGELRAGDGDSREIRGYAIVFGQESVVMWKEKGKPVVETIDREAITEELLQRSDIKMTMYHNMQILLARSNKGKGSLDMGIDERGVYFRFDAPRTMHGDEALALVRSGDIDGCSFMFATDYASRDCVEKISGDDKIRFNVRKINGLYDFTLTPDPAYPQTECAARSAGMVEEPQGDEQAKETYKAQIAEMRAEAKLKINL